MSLWVPAFNALLCLNLFWTLYMGIVLVLRHQTCTYECGSELVLGPMIWAAGEVVIAPPLLMTAVVVSASPGRRSDPVNWIGRSALFLVLGTVFIAGALIAAHMVWFWPGLFAVLLIMILIGATMIDPDSRRRENMWIRLGALSLAVGVVLTSLAVAFWVAS